MDTKKPSTRGPSYTSQEDTAVARAYIRTSEDPILCTNQKKKLFFDSIVKVYHKVYKPANHPPRCYESKQNLVKLIIAKCTVFSACYSRVLRLNPSGYNEADKLRMATGLYNRIRMTSIGDDVEERFRFVDAWKVLRNHPKFAKEAETVSESTDKTDKQPDTGPVQQQSDLNPSVAIRNSATDVKGGRPKSRKAEKLEFIKQKHYEAKLKIASEALLLEQKRGEEIQRHNDIALFMSSADMSPEAEEFFRISRRIVLEKLKKEEKQKEENAKKQRKEVSPI